MREILFRAKRKDNKKWIDGYYAVIGEKHVIIKEQPEDYYSIDDSVKKSHGNEVIEIEPETVCQYTGLKDKDNKRIFEGDFIRTFFPNITGEDIGSDVLIMWRNEFLGFATQHFNSSVWVPVNVLVKSKRIDIIGNIFDNPELRV